MVSEALKKKRVLSLLIQGMKILRIKKGCRGGKVDMNINHAAKIFHVMHLYR